jgi:hypothetical protein
VRLDRLGVDALLADAGDEHLRGNLAGAEAGHLHARGEVARRVCDGVLYVFRGHLDRQPDAIAVELLDLRLHQTSH